MLPSLIVALQIKFKVPVLKADRSTSVMSVAVTEKAVSSGAANGLPAPSNNYQELIVKQLAEPTKSIAGTFIGGAGSGPVTKS